MSQPFKQLAQNKIDYIVFHSPEAVSKLLYNHGFKVPKTPKALTKAIKALVRKKGKEVVTELLQLHPDKGAILSLESEVKSSCTSCNKQTYNSKGQYCESCGHANYLGSGDEDSFLGQFDSYSDTQLERYYRGTVKKSNSEPQNKTLAQEVQLIWNELRQRKSHEPPKEKGITTKPSNGVSKDELILFGMIFIAGILVGHGLKNNIGNVK